MKQIALVAALVLALSAAAPAQTAELTDSFTVSTTVTNTCTSLVIDDMDNGVYDPLNSVDRETTFYFKVNCSNNLPFVITLDGGENEDAGGTCISPARQMVSTGLLVPQFLAYELLNGNTDIGCDVSNSFYASGQGTELSYPVVGRIRKNLNVDAASYSDVVVATISF